MIVPAIALFVALPAFAQRDLKNIPDPDPELERKTFTVPDGFEVNLYAADPSLAKPIQMNFDAQGRLWIAASEVYPHIKPAQEATDKVIVLDDTDGDGTADKSEVFADGLLIPTGVLPGDGGVYVVNSTDLLHLSDTNGDGKADKRRIVLSGFGTEDTHHLLHTLRWGHDGCLYMNQSIYIHSHVETPHGVKRLGGGGIWQFRPETQDLSIFCRGFVNPWGHHQDRWGQHFATDGAYGEGINYVFEGAVFVTAPGAKRTLQGLNPGSPKHCGLEITSGRHLPDEWQGNMITNDFRAHRVCRFVVSEDNSGYASRQEVEVIKSNHPAFRPIDVKMGPDGAIYIADWYNPIIQHGEVDFRDPRRDHTHGRIWRVSAKGRPAVIRPKIVGAPIGELLESLKAPEEWQRLWAKQELKTRPRDEVENAIVAWVAALDKQDEQYGHHRLEALFAFQTIDRPDSSLLGELLVDSDHRIRAAAVRVAIQWRDALQLSPENFRRAAVDEHPRVRLEGVRALAQLQSAEAAQWAAMALDHPMDRFLDFAVWQTMRDLAPQWLPALQQGELDFGGNVDHLTFALKAVESPGVVAPLVAMVRERKLTPDRQQTVLSLIASLGGPGELRAVLDSVLAENVSTPAQRAELLKTLVEASRQRNLKPAGDLNPIGKLLEQDNTALAIAAASAAGDWKIEALRGPLAERATDRKKFGPDLNNAALIALARLGGEADQDLLLKLASSAEDREQRIRATAALAGADVNIAADPAIALLADAKDGAKLDMLLAPFLAHVDGPGALARRLNDKKLSPDVAKLAVRAARGVATDTTDLQTALRTAGGLGATAKKWSPEEIAALVVDVAKSGDPHRGEAIYRREEMQCQKCHAIGGAGGLVAPDMISIGASAPVDYLAESLLDPNAKVKENYHSIIVETDEGKIYSGIVKARDDKQVILRDQNDKEIVIAVSSIEDEREGRSLMPEGLVEPLTRAELVDLVAFLSQLGKEGDFAVGKDRVARRWQKLSWTPEAHVRLNRTSHDSAANADDPAFSWEPAYSRVSGDLPIDELALFTPHRDLDPVSFARCEIEVSTAGRIGLDFGDVQGLSLWIDGKPTKLTPRRMEVFDLPVGRHQFTIAVNRQAHTSPLRLELADVENSPAKAEFVTGK
jgi:putative heme-binding domain-containing protein